MQYTATRSTGETVTFPIAQLPIAFASIPDPRRKQGTRYSVAALLSLAVVALLANHTSVLAMTEWIADQPPTFRRALGFTRATTPHQTTMQRFLARLDPTAVATALQTGLHPMLLDAHRARGHHGIALDGKAQRGRLRHGAPPTHPIHAVTAFCHDLGGVVAQLVVDAHAHEGELTVAPTAIAQIDWHGGVLTGDALYCQREYCADVVVAGGDYLVLVKDNQPTLLADIQRVFAPLTEAERALKGVHTIHPLAIQTYRTVEKGHGRIEERQIRVSSELQGYSDWPSLAQVIEYTRTWVSHGVTKCHIQYGITSLPADVSSPRALARLKRDHWQIENGLHYVKDVTFKEDACQTHTGHAADILAMLRNTAISLIRQTGSTTIAAWLRHYSRCPAEACALIGISVPENA